MIILTNSGTDKLQITTTTTANVDVHVSYMDYNGTTVTPGRQNTAISTATTTDVCATPGASTNRNIKTLNVANRHASSSNLVTVIYDANGTDYTLYAVTLRAGESLEYIEGVGFFVVAASVPSGFTLKALASDYTNGAAGPVTTEVSGLTVTADVGAYFFRYALIYQTAATTTGLKLSVNHTGTVTEFLYNWQVVDNTATAATAAADQDAVAATGQVYSVFAARAKSTTGTGTTISVDTANADMFVIVEGVCVVTATGSLALWAGPEIASSTLTIKDGSSLFLLKAS